MAAMIDTLVNPLDLWTLFVEIIFGGFWITVGCLILVMFIIMGVFGRVSITSVISFLAIFLLAMVLGYGYVWMYIPLTLAILVWTSFVIVRAAAMRGV